MKKIILFSILFLFGAFQIRAVQTERSKTHHHTAPTTGHTTYCNDYHTIQAITDARNQGDWKTVKRITGESCGLSSTDSQCPGSWEAEHSCPEIFFDSWPLPE